MSETKGETVTASTTIETAVRVETKRQPLPPRERLERIFDIQGLDAIYGSKPALKGVTMEVYENLVTAVIGPSGCGKSTFIRCLNRMNDLVPGFRQTGAIRYHGVDIASGDVDPVAVRRTIGMVFQRPNPFPKSIFDNVAWGLKVLGMKDNLSDRVERALTQAALWDEVKDRLKASGLSLSGGQQQRLCIARAIAVEPDVVLMDEPASALDPIATQAIEQLLHELKSEYSFVIVTHNMQQAARVADSTAFFLLGNLVEFDKTETMFTKPSDQRTEDYITGRFG
jgi:phosphate transport system ATP-binding protein